MTQLEIKRQERRREVRIANERAKNHATGLTQLASAVVVTGLVIPLFDEKAGADQQQSVLTFIVAALLYALGHIMLSTMDVED